MSAKTNILEQRRAWGEIVYGANVCPEMKKKNGTSKKTKEKEKTEEIQVNYQLVQPKFHSLNTRGWERVWEFVRVVFGKPVDFGVRHTGSPSGPGGPLSPKSPGKPWGHRESRFNAPLRSESGKKHLNKTREPQPSLRHDTKLTTRGWHAFTLLPCHSSPQEQTNKQK